MFVSWLCHCRNFHFALSRKKKREKMRVNIARGGAQKRRKRAQQIKHIQPESKHRNSFNWNNSISIAFGRFIVSCRWSFAVFDARQKRNRWLIIRALLTNSYNSNCWHAQLAWNFSRGASSTVFPRWKKWGERENVERVFIIFFGRRRLDGNHTNAFNGTQKTRKVIKLLIRSKLQIANSELPLLSFIIRACFMELLSSRNFREKRKKKTFKNLRYSDLLVE